MQEGRPGPRYLSAPSRAWMSAAEISPALLTGSRDRGVSLELDETRDRLGRPANDIAPGARKANSPRSAGSSDKVEF